MCLRQPKVLTKSTLKSSSLRVNFFSEELDMPPPFSDVQKVVLRCPQILWLDMDVFMRPNCRILREQLNLDKDGVKKLLLFFPAVLCYNPMTLQRACRQALAMLTGKTSSQYFKSFSLHLPVLSINDFSPYILLNTFSIHSVDTLSPVPPMTSDQSIFIMLLICRLMYSIYRIGRVSKTHPSRSS